MRTYQLRSIYRRYPLEEIQQLVLEIVRLRDLFDEIESSRPVVHRCWSGLYVRVERLFLGALPHHGRRGGAHCRGCRRAQRPVGDGVEPRLSGIDTGGAAVGHDVLRHAAHFVAGLTFGATKV